jgi:hypothetical protein
LGVCSSDFFLLLAIVCQSLWPWTFPFYHFVIGIQLSRAYHHYPDLGF